MPGGLNFAGVFRLASGPLIQKSKPDYRYLKHSSSNSNRTYLNYHTISMPTHLGFVGASAGGSWAARSHIPYLTSSHAKELDLYKITAVQNSSVASAEKAAESFNLGKISTYDNSAALASDKDVDVVAVSVKVPLHLEALLPALEAGKDVFSEWPLARNLEEARRLTTLAKEKGVRTMIGLQARQNPSVIAAKRLVEQGELGEILGTTMHGYGMILGEKMTPDMSYITPIENGANLVTIPFGHAVDALCWVLGELESLQAILANRRPQLDIVSSTSGELIERVSKTSHDFIAVNGTLQNGGGPVNVVYQGGSNPLGPSFRWQIDGTKGSLLLEGRQGHVQMWQPTIKFIKSGETEGKDVEGVKWVGDDFSYAVGQAWEAFAGKGEGNVTTWEDALLRHKMIDAIYKSNEKGTREKYV